MATSSAASRPADHFLLDGVDVTEQHQGGTWIQTSVDALQEFSVQQNAFSAEFAAPADRSTPHQVRRRTCSTATCSSSCAMTTSTPNFFAASKRCSKRNQFGGTLGGPVFRMSTANRTFFFASYEGQRRDRGRSSTSHRADAGAAQRRLQRPRADLRSADDDRQHARAASRATRFPQARISPQAQFFIRYIPLPNTPGQRSPSNPITASIQDQFTLRAISRSARNNRLFVRFSRHRNQERRPPRSRALGSTHLAGTGPQHRRSADSATSIAPDPRGCVSAACTANIAPPRTSRGRASIC